MTFRSVFIAVFLGTAILVAAFVLNSRRPAVDTNRANALMVKATGKCAGCHEKETSAIVRQYERSRHASVGTTCLDCHRSLEG